MPRVKLGTPTPAQQRAVMNKIIKKAMVDCDIEDYTRAAPGQVQEAPAAAADEKTAPEPPAKRMCKCPQCGFEFDLN